MFPSPMSADLVRYRVERSHLDEIDAGTERRRLASRAQGGQQRDAEQQRVSARPRHARRYTLLPNSPDAGRRAVAAANCGTQ